MTEDQLIPAKALLRGFAQRVTSQTKAQVVLTSQSDSTYAWQGSLIHPLQPLENSHQRASSEAVWWEKNPEKHQEVSGKALGDYFSFSVSSPSYISLPDNVSFEEQLREANKIVSITWKEAKEAKSGASLCQDKYASIQNQLLRALELISNIVTEFDTIRKDHSVAEQDLPILTEISKAIAAAKRSLSTENRIGLGSVGSSSAVSPLSSQAPTGQWSSLYECLSTHVKPALKMTESMMTGLACIQIFQVIDTFYLYRLLVKYRIEGDEEIEDGTKRHVSGDLTDILNNEQQWVRDWLKAKMVDLNRVIEDIGDVGFHLKGGRALYYVLRQPELGKNDWDTSVLLNPDYSPHQWYQKLGDVHNVVLERLQRYKREFFVIAHKSENMASMRDSLQKKDAAAPAELEYNGLQQLELVQQAEHIEGIIEQHHMDNATEPEIYPPGSILFPKHRAGTKAEMIDIGIPRRDTHQSIGHWHEIIVPGVINQTWTENIPVPAHRYYIDEYMMMVRSAFDTPQKKVEKRVTRLAAMLNIGSQDNDPNVNMNNAVQAAFNKVNGSGITTALTQVQNLPTAEKRLLTVMLEEFLDAYGLAWETGLAGAFDQKFRALMDDVNYVTYSESIQKCLDVLTSNEDKSIVQRIGFVHKLAHEFEQHFVARADYFGFRANGNEDNSKPKILAIQSSQQSSTNTSTGHPQLTDTSSTSTQLQSSQLQSNPLQTSHSQSSQGSSSTAKDRRRILGAMVRIFYSASILADDTSSLPVFSPLEELQIQFAVTGSFAAYLHADYAANLRDDSGLHRVPAVLREQLKHDLDPVNVIEIKVFCDPRMKLEKEAIDRGETIAKNVYQSILEPALTRFLTTPNVPAFKMTQLANDDVIIYWPESVTMGSLTYQPAVFRLRVVQENWPQLSYVWGFPVLSLPDLIREYDEQTAATIEYTAEQRLAKTSALLRALVTYFGENSYSDEPIPYRESGHGSNSPPPGSGSGTATYPRLYYTMICAPTDADAPTRRSAYRKKVLLHHPDRNQDFDNDYWLGLNQVIEDLGEAPKTDARDVARYLLGKGSIDTNYPIKRALHELRRDFDAPYAIDQAYRELGGTQVYPYDSLKRGVQRQWLNIVKPAYEAVFVGATAAGEIPAALTVNDRDVFDGGGGHGLVMVYKGVVTETNPSIVLYALCHETGHTVAARKIRSMAGRTNADVPGMAGDEAKQHEYIADLIAIHVIKIRIRDAVIGLSASMDSIATKLGAGDAIHPSGVQRVAKMRRLLNGDNTLDELINDILDHAPHGNL